MQAQGSVPDASSWSVLLRHDERAWCSRSTGWQPQDRAGNFGSADLAAFQAVRARVAVRVQGGTTRFETVQGGLRAADGQARVGFAGRWAGLDAAGTLVFRSTDRQAGHRVCAPAIVRLDADRSPRIGRGVGTVAGAQWGRFRVAGAVVGQQGAARFRPARSGPPSSRTLLCPLYSLTDSRQAA